MHTSPLHPVAAVLWYSDEANYQGFKAVSADKEEFFDTHAEWLATAEKKYQEQKRRGVALRQIKADAPAFALWCQVQSRIPDGRARASYAAMLAATADHSGN